MHAERDIALPILSVCLSVCLMPVLCQNESIYRLVALFGSGIVLVFFVVPTTPLLNAKGTPQRGEVRGVGNFSYYLGTVRDRAIVTMEH